MNTNFIPKKIFIVPYRNRSEQKFFFCKYMSFLLEYVKDYEIYFSHQSDERSFNRGACRNIGFLAMKDKYPNDYQDITFIFNDLDTIPFNRIFDYETQDGVVKHYYGFTHSLGGIVVIKGKDFEDVNGYPNFWSWGLEDTCLQKRCLALGLTINRDDFYKVGSPQILQLFDGVDRIINKKDPHKLNGDDGSNGLSTLYDIEYSISKKSTNDMDNLYSSLGTGFNYINILQFFSETAYEDDEYFTYDLREPISKITTPDVRKRTKKVNIKPKDWTNIPYYPTNEERKRMAEEHTSLQPNKLPPPPSPSRSFNNNTNTNPSVIPKARRPVRSSLDAIQQGKMQSRMIGNITQKVTGYVNEEQPKPVFQQQVNSNIIIEQKDITPTNRNNLKENYGAHYGQQTQPHPTTFKQMKQENANMFPPKSMNSPGGASALNKINLRYRMTKI